jgi:DNA-binding SARP family transcriptional activator
MPLSLEFLGGFRLQTESGESVCLPTRKAWALLAYLALHPGQSQSRVKLAALLWGDRPEAQARDSLRQALSLVRRALARGNARALIAHSGTITLRPADLRVDVFIFEQLATQPRPECLEEAVGVYRGEFLEGLQVQAPEFESWAPCTRGRASRE